MAELENVKTRSVVAPTRRMTYEEFLQWADEDVHAEWVKGEVVVQSPASSTHQRICLFLSTILGHYVQQHDLGEILTAPFQMKLEDTAREPDVLFVAKERLERIKEAYLDGPADLVVEIVSADSGGRDRGEKFYEYEAAGVREYWLIDPERQQAEFYQLGQDGRYRLVAPDEHGRYRSAVLGGLWLDVGWLWQQPLPRVIDVLRHLGLIPPD